MRSQHASKLSNGPFTSIIGRKIIVILILISSSITLLATLIQLYNDYRYEVNSVENRYKEVRQVHANSLATTLWEYNERQLQIYLEGLARLPDISFIRVSAENDNSSWQAGTPVIGDKFDHTIELVFQANDNTTPFLLGELYIESSAEQIYRKLLATFLSVLVTNAIKTFIVAGLILWVFQLSINNRIMEILHYLDNFRPSQKLQLLELEKTPMVTSEKDELSVLALSINQLSRTLSRFYQEIEQERDRFTDFANASSDWLWETDAAGTLLYASPTMLEQLSERENDTGEGPVTDPLQLAHSPGQRAKLTDLIPSTELAEALADRRDFKGLEVPVNLGGREHSFVFHAKAVTGPDQILTFRGSAIDISHRKAAEAAIRELNETLEQRVAQRTRELEDSVQALKNAQQQLIEQEKMAAQGSLVAGIAHEINTPLGVAITASSLLEPNPDSPDHEAYHLMQENLQRVVHLIQVFKQSATDMNNVHAEPVFVRQLLNDVIVGLRPRLQEKQVQVDLECDAQLNWPTIPYCWVQIFHQLLSNSLQHGFDEDGPTADQGRQIHISLQVQNQELVIRYRDNGRGMAQAQLQQLFKPFTTSKRSQGCTGLGMHIVFNQISQGLKGRIKADSAPGQGVCLEMVLPPLPETLALSD